MARKAKVDNAVLKRLARQEDSRKQDVNNKRRYYLIVCEGTETEPNYFTGLKDNLLLGVIDTIELRVEGTGHNTLTVIEDAQKARKRLEDSSSRTFDEVWAVIDRDSFPEDHFNNAIFKGQAVGVKCAWTNEAFELWYLLHFQFFHNGMSRKQYKALIERELSQKLGRNYTYQKNSKEMYSLLSKHGNQEQAILWAEKLEVAFVGQTDYANHNPCTKVHTLIAKLLYPDKKEDESMTDYLQRRRTKIRKKL
ncbi:RloB domain-containing protein [Spirosoma sp. HMF3257]|uniref:RloB domain-containing protein n=1 Tax=Spirosoma telluris TaxID=2183553 RepID=A0A327NJD6_9BACT|nr:RloB domain-containing protein [Spirosoma telluris]RAI74479.1 RloB domain-containing protein [Spirosoma telluris]